jgi:putative ubiquitin-RnfH superfamily antitoxin RatB of RatAB toxin-antitoxin module
MRFANELKTFMDDTSQRIRVEVAYAKPDEQVIIPLLVDAGTTIEEAIDQSGILEQFPEINLDQNRVGIFGKISKKSQVLRESDRIEIYRPLIADPKEVRKQRAKEGKAMKKGAGQN